MAQMKEQIATPEKELSDEEIANLSDAEFKTLVIMMLTEMIEYGCKIVKTIQSETKENVQGTNSDRKETRTQINDLEQKEETNIQLEQNEETRIQKKKKREKRLRNLWDDFKYYNIWIIGVPEAEEQQQEIENLFEQIMKENFPSLAKGIDF